MKPFIDCCKHYVTKGELLQGRAAMNGCLDSRHCSLRHAVPTILTTDPRCLDFHHGLENHLDVLENSIKPSNLLYGWNKIHHQLHCGHYSEVEGSVHELSTTPATITTTPIPTPTTVLLPLLVLAQGEWRKFQKKGSTPARSQVKRR